MPTITRDLTHTPIRPDPRMTGLKHGNNIALTEWLDTAHVLEPRAGLPHHQCRLDGITLPLFRFVILLGVIGFRVFMGHAIIWRAHHLDRTTDTLPGRLGESPSEHVVNEEPLRSDAKSL